MFLARGGRVAATVLLVAVCASFLPPALGGVPSADAAGAMRLTALGYTYTENFDTLAGSGSSTAVPTGWHIGELGANANLTYAAGTGSDNTGDTYSFGIAAAERALGTLRSGSLNSMFGAQFTNNTGGTIESLAISFTGEQWRLGQVTAGRLPDRLDFQFSTDATSVITGTWIDHNGLDFASPVISGTVGAIVGNIAGNRVEISSTISGLNIVNGASFWLHWVDSDLAGSDDGLALDDFNLTAYASASGDDAPYIYTVSPPHGASSVPLGNTLAITFSEAVTVTAPWYALNCSISGTKTAVVTGGPTSFSLDPDTDFANGDSCTLMVAATEVTDQDAVDPPDNMAANYQATFAAGDACQGSYTPIAQIQGSGATAAITGTLTTMGTVVGDYEGSSPALRGFFIQDAAGDGNPTTSDGIFVFNGSNANSVSLGDIVRVTGTAGENQGQTQLSVLPANILKCGSGTLAPADVTLPVPSADFLERYEGMLVRMPQTLYVTEHYQLGRFGQVVLSSSGRLPQPTNVVSPGLPALSQQAANNLNRIILDDALNNQNPDPIVFGRAGQPLSAANTLRGGDTVANVVGVLNYTWAGNIASANAYRVRPINALGSSLPDFQPANLRPTSAQAPTGRVRVAGMNLLNFFNTYSGCTNGVGGTAIECRGASDQIEFERQWPKTVTAIIGTGADIVGVVEVENDGYAADSALQFLVDRLNAATSPGDYAFIDADAGTAQVNALGTDAIKVGLIYKPAKVAPVGQTATLNSVAFTSGGDSGQRNRPALAQAFAEVVSGARFVVSIVHLKSKGSACDTPDAGDGQGNCSLVRTEAARQLASWLATDPTASGDADVLILGDLNSYAKEDPIAVLAAGGYVNLVETFNGPNAYSYVFDGQWGYLDHAMANAALAPQVVAVAGWHINADEPSALDYTTDFKSAAQQLGLYSVDEFRIADHDPVLVDLNPAYTVPITDRILGSLDISPGSLTPAFDPAITTYTAQLPQTAQSLEILPAMASANSTISVDGASLAAGVARHVLLTAGQHVTSLIQVKDLLGARVNSYTIVVNRAPDAISNAWGTSQGSTVSLDLLASATDLDGDALTLQAVTPLSATNGTVRMSGAGGEVVYTPTVDFAGPAYFAFTAADTHGGTDDALAYVLVNRSAKEDQGPPQITVYDPGRTVTAEMPAVSTARISLQVPPGSYTGELGPNDVFYLAFTPVLSSTQQGSLPSGLKLTNLVFTLDGYLNGSQLADLQFSVPLTLTVNYDPALDTGILSETLSLWYWDTETGNWSQDGITLVVRDVATHSATYTIAHLSTFAYIGVQAPATGDDEPEQPPAHRLYLPEVKR